MEEVIIQITPPQIVTLQVNETHEEVNIVVAKVGVNGDPGTEIELQKTATYIQWRYVGGSWVNLVALADITGAPGTDGTDGTNGTNGTNGTDGTDGREVEIQNSGTNIEWRYVGDVSWTVICTLASLKGDKGDQGIQGIQGIQGVKGDTGASAVAGKLPNSYVELASPQGVTSATLIDVPGMVTTITLDEPVEISVMCTFQMSTQSGASSSTIGVSIDINGTDGDYYERYLSGQNDTGIGAITHRSVELSPGTYTIKMHFCRTSGLSTPGLDKADMLVMAMQGAKGEKGDTGDPGETISTGNTFAGSLLFDYINKYYDKYTQTAELTITLDDNTFGIGANCYLSIATNRDDINFPAGWVELRNDYSNDTAVYGLMVFYDGVYYQYALYYIEDIVDPLIEEAITVIDNVGLTVTAGTTLTKMGAAGWDAGCASSQQILSDEGWIEFVVDAVDVANYGLIMGLSNTNPDAGSGTVKFGIYLANPSKVYSIETGSVAEIVGATFADGDKFRVRVNSGVITYEKYVTGAWSVLKTSATTATYPLLFDCCFNKDGSTNQNTLTAETVKICGYNLS